MRQQQQPSEGHWVLQIPVNAPIPSIEPSSSSPTKTSSEPMFQEVAFSDRANQPNVVPLNRVGKPMFRSAITAVEDLVAGLCRLKSEERHWRMERPVRYQRERDLSERYESIQVNSPSRNMASPTKTTSHSYRSSASRSPPTTYTPDDTTVNSVSTTRVLWSDDHPSSSPELLGEDELTTITGIASIVKAMEYIEALENKGKEGARDEMDI
ncbi:hypothetical protein HK102_008994, partial [Quaeritorhiza haematococci]